MGFSQNLSWNGPTSPRGIFEICTVKRSSGIRYIQTAETCDNRAIILQVCDKHISFAETNPLIIVIRVCRKKRSRAILVTLPTAGLHPHMLAYFNVFTMYFPFLEIGPESKFGLVFAAVGCTNVSGHET